MASSWNDQRLHDANNENVVSDAASVSQINGISNQEPDTISGSFQRGGRSYGPVSDAIPALLGHCSTRSALNHNHHLSISEL